MSIKKYLQTIFLHNSNYTFAGGHNVSASYFYNILRAIPFVFASATITQLYINSPAF